MNALRAPRGLESEMPEVKPEKIEEIKATLQSQGSVIFDLKDSFLSEAEFKRVEELAAQLPQEFIEVGDAAEPNHVYVGRFITDVERPEMVNRPLSDEAVKILGKPEAMVFFKQLFDADDLYIRRMQVNTMEEKCFVGHHLDVDSNPDYEFAVILQLGREYGGGEYIVYGGDMPPRVFTPPYRSVLISDCKYPHEVAKVTKGKRVSLVYFLSRWPGDNRRREVEAAKMAN
jgi:hypothetical protein